MQPRPVLVIAKFVYDSKPRNEEDTAQAEEQVGTASASLCIIREVVRGVVEGFWVLDLYEYQGKELLREFGVETLDGIVAESPEEAREAAEQLGGTVAIKAQVLTGGRGKAGGIKVVDDPEEAEEAAREILGMDIKGHTVRQVLVESGAEI